MRTPAVVRGGDLQLGLQRHLQIHYIIPGVCATAGESRITCGPEPVGMGGGNIGGAIPCPIPCEAPHIIMDDGIVWGIVGIICINTGME